MDLYLGSKIAYFGFSNKITFQVIYRPVNRNQETCKEPETLPKKKLRFQYVAIAKTLILNYLL